MLTSDRCINVVVPAGLLTKVQILAHLLV